MNFNNLGINDNFVKILKRSGIVTPTPIQNECIIPIKNNIDIIAEAQTGTGKTLAFLLPIFENIDVNSENIQALIITPTRELAIQITNESKKLNVAKNANILAAYGGKDVTSQIKKLKKNIHLLIATPGRLLDHLSRKTIHLEKLKTLVIDEADQMLLMGFKKEVDDIIKLTSPKRQTLCFSATINSDVKKLAYKYTKNPQVISIKKEKITLNTIKQEVIITTDRNKQDDLFNVLNKDNPFMAIIFCRTKVRVDKLEETMSQLGYNCAKIHSDIPQSKRERIMKSFRKCDIQYLIATDVASRGLDISGVDNIYNYDCPENSESYIHRIGRTGRAGNKGYTCMFIVPRNNKTLEQIEQDIQYKIPQRNLT